VTILLALSAVTGFALSTSFSSFAIAISSAALAVLSSAVLHIQGVSAISGLIIIITCMFLNQIVYLARVCVRQVRGCQAELAGRRNIARPGLADCCKLRPVPELLGTSRRSAQNRCEAHRSRSSVTAPLHPEGPSGREISAAESVGMLVGPLLQKEPTAQPGRVPVCGPDIAGVKWCRR
jgi:hypothetical protein